MLYGWCRLMIRFVFSVTLTTVAAAVPVRSEPTLLWTRDDLGEQVYDIEIMPEHGIALAAVTLSAESEGDFTADTEYAVAVLDLETGETKSWLTSEVEGQSYVPSITGLAADGDTIVLQAQGGSAGNERGYSFLGYDANSLEPLYQTFLPSEAFPDHRPFDYEPMVGSGKLVVVTDKTGDQSGVDPIIQIFDLRSGAFEWGWVCWKPTPRREGWFGRRPRRVISCSVLATTTLDINDDEGGRV